MFIKIEKNDDELYDYHEVSDPKQCDFVYSSIKFRPRVNNDHILNALESLK